jgi:hypothetical protein
LTKRDNAEGDLIQIKPRVDPGLSVFIPSFSRGEAYLTVGSMMHSVQFVLLYGYVVGKKNGFYLR